MVISAMCVSHYYQCILEYNKSCFTCHASCFWISFVAIFVGTALPLAATVATGAIKFTANEVIPIGGMLANNGLIAINLAYQNLEKAFVQDVSDIESKLTLAATPKLASKSSIRESIRLAIVPTIDSVKHMV